MRPLRWLERWAWTIPVLTLCGFAVIIGGFILAVNHLDRHDAAVYLDTNTSSPAAKAAADRLPAPPAINLGGETTRTVTTKTAPQASTSASRQVSVPVGKPVDPAAKLASDYASGLLKAPSGPGTMADVELQDVGFKYLFAKGNVEYVAETMSLRNIAPYPLNSLVVPLLSDAYDVQLNSFTLPGSPGGPALKVSKDTVTVPVVIPADSGWGYLIHIGYKVPDNFTATQTWTVPALSMQGVWLSLFQGQSYLTITGPGFHSAPGLIPQTAPSKGPVWASTGNFSLARYSPVKAGTVLSWKIVPSNPKTYPGYVYPPSGNVLGPAASANPCTNCGG